MAYNAVSGTLIAAQNYIPGDLVVGNIVSGNLSTSDGANLINIPRVSNATNNALITNVSGDANTLVCESNLTFDGGSLVVTGDLTASVSVSASYFEGDGSRLTNLPGGATGAGIFRETSPSNAYTTSSIKVGASGTAPATLSVVGGSFLSGALIHKRHTVTGDYTISITDYYIGVDTTGGTVKITLPNAAALTSGQTLVLKDEGGNSDTNAITISGSGADKIDGQNTVVLGSPYAALQLYCDGATKYFIY
ncbi:MAG TPA: hypothetical protein EYN67_13960 [Flavobacteriales bacterium]|nr:hypothetical protein [Flavobacteriales bacterium]